MKAAELFVKSLESAGITHMFGVPGEENIAMLEAIRKSSIEFVVTRDEQTATFMAAAHGRLTGRTGVSLATLGPGATNMLNGVAYAQLGAMPLLVITGQKPIKKRKQGMFQIVDIVAIMRPVTKFSETIVSAHRVPTVVHHAIRTAEYERPGAVHLELPEDIAEEETDAEIPAWQTPERPVANPASIEAMATAIQSAKMPMLVVGGGANRKTVRGPLQDFITKTGIPFATSQMGKGVVDERHELYLGTTALSANDYVHAAFNKADLVITLGYDYFEKPPLLAKAGRKVASLNFYPAETDEVWHPDIEVVGDLGYTLSSLTEKVQPGNWDYSAAMSVKQALQQDVNDQADSTSFPIKPQRFAKDLRATVPDDTILSLDNGMYKLWITRNYPAYDPNSVLPDNTLATMGAGLGVGITAKMLNPDKKVVVVAGDGGFMMNVADLETAKRLDLDLVIVILNDSGYGMIKWKQADMQMPSFGLEFTNPDFVKLAESFGTTGHRINSAEEFATTLKQAQAAGGIHIIDLPIDYSENKTLEGQSLKARTQDL